MDICGDIAEYIAGDGHMALAMRLASLRIATAAEHADVARLGTLRVMLNRTAGDGYFSGSILAFSTIN